MFGVDDLEEDVEGVGDKEGEKGEEGGKVKVKEGEGGEEVVETEEEAPAGSKDEL